MKYSLKSVLFVVLILNAACSLADIPDWVTADEYHKYPSVQYFLGVGIAEERSQAVEKARSDLVRQIKVRIESELQTEQREESKNGKVESTASVISRTKSSVDATVSGIEIAEVQQSKNNFYALAILNKSNYFQSIRTELDRIIEDSNLLLETAQDNKNQGQILNALENYKEASVLSTEYETKNNLLVSLAGQSYKQDQIVTDKEISAEMRNIIGNLQIELVSGNNQTAKSGEYLPQKVRVQVVYQNGSENAGVNNFPLVARYDNEELIAKTRTNAEGIAEFQIKAIPNQMAVRRGSAQILMAGHFLPSDMQTLLSRSACEINYKVEVPDLNFSLANIKVEQYSGLKQKAENIIASSGFEIDNSAALLIELNHEIVNTREISSPFGTQYLVEISTEFSMIKRSGREKIASYVIDSKGLSKKSKQDAERIALTRARINKEDFLSFLQRGNK